MVINEATFIGTAIGFVAGYAYARTLAAGVYWQHYNEELLEKSARRYAELKKRGNNG